MRWIYRVEQKCSPWKDRVDRRYPRIPESDAFQIALDISSFLSLKIIGSEPRVLKVKSSDL